MPSAKKQIQQLAKQYFSLSVVDGAISAYPVSGVLAYVEKHRPPHSVAVLRAYSRLIANEIARNQAVVEHAGPINDSALAAIVASMTKRYGRKITGVGRRNDALLAGVRVRVGDDVYESSVAGQLGVLGAAV